MFTHTTFKMLMVQIPSMVSNDKIVTVEETTYRKFPFLPSMKLLKTEINTYRGFHVWYTYPNGVELPYWMWIKLSELLREWEWQKEEEASARRILAQLSNAVL